MKITAKINFFTTLWVISLLIIINTVTYFLFMETTMSMEKNEAITKADTIIQRIDQQGTDNLKEILSDFQFEYSLFRIIQSDNKVIAEVTNDTKLLDNFSEKYMAKKDVERHIIATEKGEEQVLVAHIPFQLGGQETVCLEMIERLHGLEMRKEILKSILIISTILAALLSLLGGEVLGKLITKPILNMIYTMEEIEKNGTMLKIDTNENTKDELQIMAKTFNKMIDRLNENMEKQKKFVSDASHEFKTPLTVIKSYTNLLRRQGFQDEKLAMEAIQSIHSEATYIQNMTEVFLDLANLERDYVLEMSQVDIIELCQYTIAQLETVHQREINLDFTESPIIMTLDELRIKQVLIILLDNAIKYSQNKIDCYIEKNANQIVIGIQDYGIGIPKEELENIFERFYRVDKARSRKNGGFGLGLHIADTIVKLHHGNIVISSSVGEGTLAKLILPVK